MRFVGSCWTYIYCIIYSIVYVYIYIYCVYDISSVGVIQIEVGTSDHFDFDVCIFSDKCWENTLWDGTCPIYVAPLAKLAGLRYYHALSRLAWPYQFLGSVVEFQER